MKLFSLPLGCRGEEMLEYIVIGIISVGVFALVFRYFQLKDREINMMERNEQLRNNMLVREILSRNNADQPTEKVTEKILVPYPQMVPRIPIFDPAGGYNIHGPGGWGPNVSPSHSPHHSPVRKLPYGPHSGRSRR